MDREEYKKQFIERTKKHIELVNKFGAKIGKQYPHHDDSKLNPEKLLDAYYLFSVPEEERTREENDALDFATLIHITTASHHPEYWTPTNLSGFTRKNFAPNGPVDATEMPEEAMEEMCADFCAMSVEHDNTPFEWFDRVNGSRWIFSDEQQKFIKDTLNELWDEGENNNEIL